MSGYKTTCESCNGNNFYVTPHNGVGYCFNCGYTVKSGESVPRTRFEDIKALREYYTDLAIYYHGCLEPEHVQYLNQRGISDDAISKYGIGYCPDSPHVLYLNSLAQHAGISSKGKAWLAGRIVFPYWYDGYVNDIRGRTYNLTANHADKRYLSPFKDSFYRGADYPYNAIHLDLAERIVITEGEIKAIVASESGIPTVALPGIQSMRSKLLMRYDRNDVVCFDSQLDKGALDVRRAIIRLHTLLRKISIATIPVTHGDKGEIDTHVLAFGADSFKRIISRALSFDIWKKLTQ